MDGILGIGPLEIIIIVVLALIFLGPERLPGTIREIAKFIRQMRAIGNELTSQFSQELNMLDEFNPKKIFDDITGLSEDELKIEADLGIDRKGNVKKPAKKPTTNTPAVSQSTKPKQTSSVPKKETSSVARSKPALGETDPNEISNSDSASSTESQSAPSLQDAVEPAATMDDTGTVATIDDAPIVEAKDDLTESTIVSAVSEKEIEEEVIHKEADRVANSDPVEDANRA